MVVKNEDRWVWYAIQSVLPYVDRLLISDTGSTDRTLNLVKSIKSQKIKLVQIHASTAAEITAVRQRQIEATSEGWIWFVDGDEIYTKKGGAEITRAVRTAKYRVIAVRRFDLLGDIYHRQHESVGTYRLYGESGHLLVRLVNLAAFPGLHYQGDYPLEGLYDAQGTSILGLDRQQVYLTQEHLYHAMYLQRSSLGRNLANVFNRSKYKIETGLPVRDRFPEVFDSNAPPGIPDPRHRRSLAYEALAAIITPVKELKRVLL